MCSGSTLRYLLDPPARHGGRRHGLCGRVERQGRLEGNIVKALRSYFAFPHERGDIPVNPATGLKVRKKKYLTPPALSEFELKRLESAAFERDPRHGWAIRLMYSTGARVESAAEVRPEDIDLRDSTIAFRTAKGDKPYRVPLGSVGREAAEQLLRLHDPPAGTDTPGSEAGDDLVVGV